MPKRTFQPNNRRRAKTHGFRARMASKSGQAVLKRRRAKGRKRLTPSPLLNFSMNYEGLLRSQQFQAVYKVGRRYDGRFMSVFIAPNDLGFDRFGITASRKVSRRAVDRNRMKRLLRESIRSVVSSQSIGQMSGRDWVLNARRSLLAVKTPEVRRELERLTTKAIREQQPEAKDAD